MNRPIPAFTPSRELLETRRGPIDGRKFFSRSPFRSGHFLAATAVCLVDLLYAVIMLYQYWPRLSTFAAAVIWTITLGLARTWWRAFQYINRVRDLYSESSLTEMEPGSPFDIALGIAAGAINDILIYGSSTTMLLLAYTRTLLSHLWVN